MASWWPGRMYIMIPDSVRAIKQFVGQLKLFLLQGCE